MIPCINKIEESGQSPCFAKCSKNLNKPTTKLKPVFIMSIMGHNNYETTLSYTHLLKKSNDQQVSLAGSFV